MIDNTGIYVDFENNVVKLWSRVFFLSKMVVYLQCEPK